LPYMSKSLFYLLVSYIGIHSSSGDIDRVISKI
jgi:hypothetical protein